MSKVYGPASLSLASATRYVMRNAPCNVAVANTQTGTLGPPTTGHSAGGTSTSYPLAVGAGSSILVACWALEPPGFTDTEGNTYTHIANDSLIYVYLADRAGTANTVTISGTVLTMLALEIVPGGVGNGVVADLTAEASASSATTVSASTSGAFVTTPELLVAFVFLNNGATVNGVTDNQTNYYAYDYTAGSGDTLIQAVAAWGAATPSSGPLTTTATWSGDTDAVLVTVSFRSLVQASTLVCVDFDGTSYSTTLSAGQSSIRRMSTLHSVYVTGSALTLEIVTADESIDPKWLFTVQAV